jgi:lysyl-tRNA synthetase, class I
MMATQLHAKHWLDKVTDGVLSWQKKQNVSNLWVDDMKTPSGRVHTGALRGVLLHDLVAKNLELKTMGSVTNTYVFNDMDPMDSLPGYLPKEIFAQYMGVPLHLIPAPKLDQSGVDFSRASQEEKTRYSQAKSFAEFYAMDFIDAFRSLGCSQTIIWSHELYEQGKIDAAIKTALDSIDTIRTIYKEVADYQLPKNWYPFQVICPECKKVGTTLTTGWNGVEVSFECQPKKVEWAVGCGYTGTTTPFGGTGKLLWKVDWPAHWATLGITVEGAGKDHTSAGGSRDMANALCHQVFNLNPPFDIPYEWILIKGVKMSSSKGIGTSAREFVRLFPPTIGRFLFANRDYNQVIDFDPTSLSIFWEVEEGDKRLGRAFELAQFTKTPEPHFLPRFRDIALWMQHPELNLIEKCAEVKGSPLTTLELAELDTRKQYAQTWVAQYAPEEYQLAPKETLPEEAKALTDEQVIFLTEAMQLIAEKNWDPAELQQALFEKAKESIGPQQAFQAIYLAFLGKKAGPRAAWFLLSIDPELRRRRISELANTTKVERTNYLFANLNQPDILTISKSVIMDYPTLIIGTATIEGVTIAESSEQLKQEMVAIYTKSRSITNQEINDSLKIQSYRKAIKQSGIDWHSRRPTMDALLRRISKGELPPSINNVADIGNLLAVKHQMSQGLFDLDQVQFPTIFKQSLGSETAVLFGSQEPLNLKAGELCYFDKEGPFAVDLCWRDAQRTSVTANTTNLLIQTEGIFDISRDEVEMMLQDLIAYITKYAGGTVKHAGIVEATKS